MTHWVIERYYNNVPCYWSPGMEPTHAVGSSRPGWTLAEQHAVRLGDEKSALAVLLHLLDGEGRIVQRDYRSTVEKTPVVRPDQHPVEDRISNLVGMIEGMGADPRLSDAVLLMGYAKNRVSAFIDKKDAWAIHFAMPGYPPVPHPFELKEAEAWMLIRPQKLTEVTLNKETAGRWIMNLNHDEVVVPLSGKYQVPPPDAR